jgi:hypothetical protein
VELNIGWLGCTAATASLFGSGVVSAAKWAGPFQVNIAFGFLGHDLILLVILFIPIIPGSTVNGIMNGTSN